MDIRQALIDLIDSGELTGRALACILEHMAPTWTDCRDDLPPEHTPVLVCWQGVARVATATNNRWPWNGTKRRWLIDGHSRPSPVPPTHWMELPVPVGVEQ